MASRKFSFFSFTLIVLIFFLSCSDLAYSFNKKLPPFQFLKRLQGCHKGDKIKGIQELKEYLKYFGYLRYKNRAHANDDYFDDVLESAIKMYQQNYRLKTTGSLTSETVSKMMMPRCGVADLTNGTIKKSSNAYHTSGYTFFPGNPKWPASKYALTYELRYDTPPHLIPPLQNAFQAWANVTPFTFSPFHGRGNPDITIGLYKGDHGDGYPFDAFGAIAAHSWPPQDGRLHFNSYGRFCIGAFPNLYDFGTVASHEIGHLLGLGHSRDEEAIMYPVAPFGRVKGIHQYDIEGVRALYEF
ncbi:metalloendoproteinase 5-MMP [Jatropha curcas]|uniref:metalloendoproteinase 5-MMP n=1 Tax=Jatropha curcas TaxID=180498 RepID=UPI0005FB9C0E|nr:metalloendoproteinase 5-MMP [Jatropha curcas]